MSTDGPELRDLMGHVERLEKQNRWLKRAGIAVLAAVSAVLLMGQAALSWTITEPDGTEGQEEGTWPQSGRA